MLACLKTSRSGKVSQVGDESHYDPALLEKKQKRPTVRNLPSCSPATFYSVLRTLLYAAVLPAKRRKPHSISESN